MSNNTKPKGLSRTLKTFFGVGDGAFVLMSNIETFYFMTFLTNLAGFAPAMAALINSIFSIIDACLSWIYGGILNGTKAHKWGRYRSWLIMTPWIVPFLYAFQFIKIGDNAVLSAALIIIAAVSSHVIWNLGYVANSTLVTVVGKTPEDRATLASSRAAWNNIGGLVFSYAGLPFATWLANFVGEKNQFAAAAFILGIVMVLGYFAHFKMTDGYEEIETGSSSAASHNKISVGDMFKSLFQNPQLMILIVADLAKWCVNFVSKASAIYYFRDAAGKPGLMVQYSLLISLGAIAGAYCARYLAKTLSNRTTMIISYVGMAAFLFMIYISYANSTMVLAFITIAQFFYGMALGIVPAVYGDTVTYTTWKTGKNAAGWIMGLQNVPLKVAIFLRGVILGAALTAAGWVADVKYYDEATGAIQKAGQGMTIPFALVPAVFCAVGAVLILCFFKITRDKVEKYEAEIAARG